jgi:chemotaxis protein MotB
MAAVALPGCASNELEGRVEQLHKENLEVTAERDEAVQNLAESLRREDALEQQSALRDAELANLRNDYDEALARAQEYASENERLLAAAEAEAETQDEGLQLQEVAARLQAPDRQVQVTPDGNIEITLQSDITFSSGEATITKAGKTGIRALLPALTGEFAAYEIRVVGHTDATPLKRTKAKWGSNRALGQARSRAVVEFLEQELGIAPTRLTTASKGEHAPVADNKSKDGRTKNRRVELIVVIPRQSALSMAK